MVMGTLAHLTAVATDPDTATACVEAALAEIEKVDLLMSDYKSDSEISRLNREGFKHSVKVSESTYEVLQRSVQLSKMTSGAFDITVGPLVDLWRSAQEANSVPTVEQIADVRRKVGYEKLILDANETSARFTAEGMRIDLGGIAKGYAVDKAIEVVKAKGAIGAMVEIGGEVRCFGINSNNKNYWKIGLQDPAESANDLGNSKLRLILKLNQAAIATSGDYQRFTLIEGKRYGHIMDRKTGTGTKGPSSVTIIADNATDADALATALSVLGKDKGLDLIDTIPNAEAILITSSPDYKIIKSKKAEKYID